MIVCVKPGRLKPFRLLGGKHSKSATHLEAHFADSPHHFKDMIEVLVVSDLAPCGAHAEAGCTCFLRFLCLT